MWRWKTEHHSSILLCNQMAKRAIKWQIIAQTLHQMMTKFMIRCICMMKRTFRNQQWNLFLEIALWIKLLVRLQVHKIVIHLPQKLTLLLRAILLNLILSLKICCKAQKKQNLKEKKDFLLERRKYQDGLRI